MPKSKISVIYLDMDGVIANFNKKYHEMFGVMPDSLSKKPKEFGKNFDQFIAHQGFMHLELMPGAQTLIDFLRKAPVPTQLLSSTASPARHDEISRQKLIWLQTHGITFKPNLVPGKKHKKEFAKPDALLIDDTESVIEDFRQAGGHAIWHKDIPTTMAMLRLYV